MTTSVPLDDLDGRIIRLLQENARLTNREIARRVNSSEPTVRRRVERLLAAGAMRIVAVASPFALGFPVMAILGLQIDRSRQQAIEQALKTMPEVRFMGFTLGSYDLLIEVWLASNAALLDFLNDRLAHIPGIQRSEAWQVMKLSKYSYDWGSQPAPAG